MPFSGNSHYYSHHSCLRYTVAILVDGWGLQHCQYGCCVFGSKNGVNLSSISVFVNTCDPPKMEPFGISQCLFSPYADIAWLLVSWASLLVDNCLIRSCKHSGLQCGHRKKSRSKKFQYPDTVSILSFILHVRVHTRRPGDTAIVYMLSYCMA